MKKQFLINILLLVFLNALVKPLWVFGIDRSVQNLVGSQTYGLYFALFNLSLLFNTALDMGITNFNNRSIAQKPQLFNNYFPRLIFAKFLLGIVYLAICIAAASFLDYSSAAVKLIGILALNQFLASVLLFLRSNISGLQMYITDSILSVVDRFILVLACSMLLWTNWLPFKIDIFVFAWLQTIAYTLACCIAAPLLLRKSGRFKFQRMPLFSSELFVKSLPFAVLALLMSFYSRFDAVLMERMLPDGAIQAGIYAQSYRIFDAVNMISVLFAALLLPMFANLLASKKDIRPLANLAFSILFTGTGIIAITLAGFAGPILKILYREFHPDSPFIFIMLMSSIVPVSLTYIFGTLLTADGKLKRLIILATITIVINISLNLVTIPHWGAKGAAFSALISQLFTALAQIILCFRYYQFKVAWQSVSKYLMLFLFNILLMLIMKYINFQTGISILVILLCSLAVTFSTKIINIKALREELFAKELAD